MRRIVEIGEHSVYAPGLAAGGAVLDAGANRGRFSNEIAAKFPVKVFAIEANPALAAALRLQGLQVTACALGAKEGSAIFHIGTNDEASSTRAPGAGGAHLVIRESVEVAAKTLESVLSEMKISGLACVKLDIEGSEVDVLNAVGSAARRISPQWTVEFHDDPQFRLCEAKEVDCAIATMLRAGFSVLIRNWPSRTNVLFVDRRALAIGWLDWIAMKIRYQYLALIWRKLAGLR
jgi:FkbM family methyltransferase